MVALSILFSYGLQFCVPSEIVWSRLEPWLRKRRNDKEYSNNKNTAIVTVNTITGSNLSTTTGLSINTLSVDEKKQLEMETKQQEKPMDGAYYVMRALMILGTGTLFISID